jgi:hypothetical protein
MISKVGKWAPLSCTSGVVCVTVMNVLNLNSMIDDCIVYTKTIQRSDGLTAFITKYISCYVFSNLLK